MVTKAQIDTVVSVVREFGRYTSDVKERHKAGTYVIHDNGGCDVTQHVPRPTAIRLIYYSKYTSWEVYVEGYLPLETLIHYALTQWSYFVECFRRERRHCLEVWLGGEPPP